MRRTKMMMAGSALALSLALSACGGGDEGSAEPASPSESASESAPESAETPSESPSESESEAAQAGGSSDYCQQLESANKQFTALATGDLSQFDAAITTLQDLGDAAPAEIADSWKQVLAPLNQLETALGEAGLTFDDLEGLSRGEIPPGVDPQSLQQLATEVQGLSSTDAAQAQQEISQQASDECGVDLGQ
ncbi:hypothetical protein [Nocardioides sp. AX2bis]|uniref:hypothetical protein n=1 Tax=Nocardioides sp. AX2bis TaxID=2653157 RepID=UPI0012F1993F|nr:hypothetical protein [Nocardioides sp. AX2bis]VXC54690.1 exported hypothetical protein [Nocardioides sp. AX2bis]